MATPMVPPKHSELGDDNSPADPNLHAKTKRPRSGPLHGSDHQLMVSRRQELPHAPWSDLLSELVARVASSLPCRADRVNLAIGIKDWYPAVKQVANNPPPQLPWLLFPSNTARGKNPLFYSTMGEKAHELRFPADVKRGRVCGSFDGGWLFLELDESRRHTLYNLNSQQRIAVSSTAVTIGLCRHVRPLAPYLRAAVLSAPPAPGAYLIAAIEEEAEKPNSIAVWQDHMEHWTSFRSPLGEAPPEDLVYHKGAFYFITSSAEVVVLTPALDQNGKLQSLARTHHYRTAVPLRGVEERASTMFTRYLMESRGQLLMVVRKFDYLANGGCATNLLWVYRFNVEDMQMQPRRASWVDVGEQLDGRMLFVGRGCSRCFQVAEFLGFQRGTIYFLDDALPGPYKYHNLRDIGRFSMAEMGVEMTWPPVYEKKVWPRKSDCSPPIWLLH